jgi:hypothetical protein
VTRGFMGPLGGFWPKLGRKRVTGWKQRSCVPPGRVKTNKQTILFIFANDIAGCQYNFIQILDTPDHVDSEKNKFKIMTSELRLPTFFKT